jgi:hypothetical protein
MEQGLFTSIRSSELQNKIYEIFGTYEGLISVEKCEYKIYLQLFLSDHKESEVRLFFNKIGLNDSDIDNLYLKCYIPGISMMKISLTSYPKILKLILEIEEDVLFRKDVFIMEITSIESLFCFTYFRYS